MVTFKNPVEVTVTPRGGSGWLPAAALVVAAAVLARAGVAVAHQASALLRDVLWFGAALAFPAVLAYGARRFARWEKRREAQQVAEPLRWRGGERMRP